MDVQAVCHKVLGLEPESNLFLGTLSTVAPMNDVPRNGRLWTSGSEGGILQT
jgi:hypothetical protein